MGMARVAKAGIWAITEGCLLATCKLRFNQHKQRTQLPVPLEDHF